MVMAYCTSDSGMQISVKKALLTRMLITKKAVYLIATRAKACYFLILMSENDTSVKNSHFPTEFV